jgi:hypothetical protein
MSGRTPTKQEFEWAISECIRAGAELGKPWEELTPAAQAALEKYMPVLRHYLTIAELSKVWSEYQARN